MIKDHFGPAELYIHKDYKECASSDTNILHFLPAYDEYIISYKDRTNVLDLEHHPKAFNSYGIFQSIILYNGHGVGNWKKIKKAKVIDFDISFWDSKFKIDKELLALEGKKFQDYSKK